MNARRGEPGSFFQGRRVTTTFFTGPMARLYETNVSPSLLSMLAHSIHVTHPRIKSLSLKYHLWCLTALFELLEGVLRICIVWELLSPQRTLNVQLGIEHTCQTSLLLRLYGQRRIRAQITATASLKVLTKLHEDPEFLPGLTQISASRHIKSGVWHWAPLKELFFGPSSCYRLQVWRKHEVNNLKVITTVSACWMGEVLFAPGQSRETSADFSQLLWLIPSVSPLAASVPATACSTNKPEGCFLTEWVREHVTFPGSFSIRPMMRLHFQVNTERPQKYCDPTWEVTDETQQSRGYRIARGS